MKELKTIKWIGLAKIVVVNNSDILNGAKSAFTNVVGLAKTKIEFRKVVNDKLQAIDLKLIRLEEAEPLKDRLNKFTVSKDILKNAKGLLPIINPVSFSTFHTYSEE